MKIVYAPRALSDLVAIETYISQFNPAAATRVLSIIKSSIDKLALFPKLGLPIDDQNRYRLPIVRYPYLVFYRLTDTEVLILHIRHGARRPINPADL
jgi:toxin ParE1/3/4